MRATPRSTGRGWSRAICALFLFLLSAGAERDQGIECTPTVSPARTRESIERGVIREFARQYRILATRDRLEALVDAIYEESARAEIDPLLAASIVARESRFQNGAVSSVGAIGLMQIRPFVAEELAGRLDIEWSGAEALGDPDLNMRLGISYYKELVERFDGDARKALTAYNVGPTRVQQQLRDGTYAHSAYAAGVLELYERLRAAREDEV